MVARNSSYIMVLVLILAIVGIGAGIAVVVGTTLQTQQAAPTDSGAFLDDVSFVTPGVQNPDGTSAQTFYAVQQSVIDEELVGHYRTCKINPNTGSFVTTKEAGFYEVDCTIWNRVPSVKDSFPSELGDIKDLSDFEFVDSNGVKRGQQTLLFSNNQIRTRICKTTDGSLTDSSPLLGKDCQGWVACEISPQE